MPRTFSAFPLIFIAWGAAALAQGYPSKPIRLVVGYAPGGSAEAGARPLAKALEPLLGRPLVFEYRPGAAGGVAMEAMAKLPADGYTLYYYDSGPLTVAPHLTKVGYDKIASFTHLGHVCGSGSLLVVHASTPFQNVDSAGTPCSVSVGTSGSVAERFGPATASARSLPDCTCGSALGPEAIQKSTRPSIRSV